MKLEIENLCAGYGKATVVENLNLALEGNEILMLVGPTGCGKSTILRTLAGILPVTSGEIRMNDLRITKSNPVPPEKRHIGMVFQDFALFPHLNVEKNIGFRLRDKSEVQHWIEVLGLESHRRAMPQTLSGGQKQRVALARALAHQPSLMLLDEPLSNLDAALKDSLRWTIRDALKEAGVPAVWVTHDQDEAMSIGDRVGILNQGKLEQLDTPENCFEHPASRFVAEFLGDASFLSAQLQENRADTPLGSIPVIAVDCPPSGDVQLLVRPDDFTLTESAEPNAQLIWSRFEGGSRLCKVKLNKGGEEVKVRVSHEVQPAPGEAVRLDVIASHPLMAFRREGGHSCPPAS
ncbi:ABC transporter ATP-binding protein [Verrucomicrobiaceae bacterium R5-34]|nr:ABC transporter ATP-binding protein [Verrucomicrobiaceae bacterium R5-34]